MSWGFQPDAARSSALSTEINLRLGASLCYVFGEVGDALGVADVDFQSWITALEQAGRPDPLVHVLFHSIVADVQAGAWDRAKVAASRLLTLGGARVGLSVAPVDADIAGARPVDLFSRFADIEEDNRLDFVAPDPDLAAGSTALIQQGLELIERNDAALDGELRALVAEILIVAQAPGHRFTTAALSCFQNWGALLINPSAQRDVLDVVETLAHEATHLTLFALALDEPLLLNAPEERYYSPLRQAPRSMDGVYHATIVSARVTRALLRQSQASGDDDAFRRLALERAAAAMRCFDEGLAIVDADARFSPQGRQVVEDSKAFMAQARPRLLTVA